MGDDSQSGALDDDFSAQIMRELGWKFVEHSAYNQVTLRCRQAGGGFQPLPVETCCDWESSRCAGKFIAMKLPNHEQAVVAPPKIRQYLLNEDHPRGKSKAVFFTHFGFSVAQWEVLAQALLTHAVTHEVSDTLTTPEGTHYTVESELTTPDGRSPQVRSVWAIDTDSDIPRFITAYPLKKRKEGEA